MAGTPGTQTFTADAILGDVAGTIVRIYTIYWVKETGAETMVIRSGSTASDSRRPSACSLPGTVSVERKPSPGDWRRNVRLRTSWTSGSKFSSSASLATRSIS